MPYWLDFKMLYQSYKLDYVVLPTNSKILVAYSTWVCVLLAQRVHCNRPSSLLRNPATEVPSPPLVSQLVRQGERNMGIQMLLLKSLFPLTATLILSKQRIPKFYPIPRRRDPEFMNSLSKQSWRPLTEWKMDYQSDGMFREVGGKTLYYIPVGL